MNLKSYTVTELYIYPIKSLAGIAIQTAKVEEMGFENDRRWMLIDPNNEFITQRKYPVLSQFYPKFKDKKIEILHQDSKHEFLIDETLNEPILSKVWDDETTVFEVNKKSSDWFSSMLGFQCKLVKITNVGNRKHLSNIHNRVLNVSLSDGYPYLIVGSASLNFLNQKLEEKVSIKRFRPNIVIKTEVPHEEDSFENFKINTIKFQNMKPCGRCILINTNPENGHVQKEPLKTLSQYRKRDNAVFFGTNVMSLNEGEIKVGDFLIF